MKVSDLILQLQAMPQNADVEIDLGEEYHNFTVVHATPGESEPHLVALVPTPDPPGIEAIHAKYDRLLDAAPDMLEALKAVSRNSALDESWLAPVRAAIAKAEVA